MDSLGSIRTAAAPKKIITAYKLMRLVGGKLYPLYIDRSEPVELGVWYNADSVSKTTLESLDFGYHLINLRSERVIKSRQRKPSLDQVKRATAHNWRWFYVVQQKTKIGYKNVGIAESNGREEVKADYALRPGWHCGSLPVMNQIGKGANHNLRDDSFVWTEIEISADVDYNAEAKANGGELYYIPTDGYYLKCTNANKKAAQADKMDWYIAGAIKINRIISDSEARDIIDRYNREHGTKIAYDYQRESGKMFNADTMQLEGCLNGTNDFYALFSDDNDLLVDFGVGWNRRDVRRKAVEYMKEHNIQSAFIEITDCEGEIKDTIDIDLGLQGTKKAPRKQTDSWYIDKLRHKFFMQLVTKARVKVEVAQELSLMAVDAMVEFGQWKNRQYESPENTTDRLKAHEILCRITDKLLDKRIIAKADAALAIGDMIRDCLLDFAKWKDKQHDKGLQGNEQSEPYGTKNKKVVVNGEPITIRYRGFATGEPYNVHKLRYGQSFDQDFFVFIDGKTYTAVRHWTNNGGGYTERWTYNGISVSSEKKLAELILSMQDNGLQGTKKTDTMRLDGADGINNYKKQLRQFFAKTFSGWFIEVTMPKQFLIDCGIPNNPIVIRPATLIEKIKKHQLTKQHLENLNTCLNSPLIVYKSATYTGAFNVVIEKSNNEGLLCVALHPEEKINKIVVSEIATIGGRRLEQLTNWAESKLTIDSNIEKIKKVLIGSQFNSAKSEYLISLLEKAKIEKEIDIQEKKQKNLSGTSPSVQLSMFGDGDLGMAVHHNSPYLLKKADGSFVDKKTGKRLGFDTKYMGKGEGNQAHGWGIYVSKEDLRRYGGRESIKVYYKGELLYDIISNGAFFALEKSQMNVDWAIKYAQSAIETTKKSMLPPDRKKELIEQNNAIISELQQLNQSDIELDEHRHNYTVEIPDNDGTNYLEEDGLLTDEQFKMWSKAVLSLVSKADKPAVQRWINERDRKELTGKKAYFFVDGSGASKKASKALHKAGFVGIHYNGGIDGSCYVIFDENDAKIVSHNLFGLQGQPDTKSKTFKDIAKDMEKIKKAGKNKGVSGAPDGLKFITDDYDDYYVGDWFYDSLNDRIFRIAEKKWKQGEKFVCYFYTKNGIGKWTMFDHIESDFNDFHGCKKIEAPDWYTEGKAHNIRIVTQFFVEKIEKNEIPIDEEYSVFYNWRMRDNAQYIERAGLTRSEVINCFAEAEKIVKEKNQPTAESKADEEQPDDKAKRIRIAKAKAKAALALLELVQIK